MEKKLISISEVTNCLKQGLTRDEIAEKFGITKAECKKLFEDNRLKGKRTIKQVSFEIVE